MFLLVILLLGWLNSVVGKPCPSNSLFLFSQSHKESVCMCTPSFQCHGDCISGHDANPNAFKSSAAGFLPDCVDCYCQHNQNQHQSPNLNGNGVKITDVHTGKSIYDHKDILFQAYCFVDKEVTPPVPKALKSLNWFHIPKCGSSFGTTLYNYMCRNYNNAPTLKRIVRATNQHLTSILQRGGVLDRYSHFSEIDRNWASIVDFTTLPGQHPQCWKARKMCPPTMVNCPYFEMSKSFNGVLSTSPLYKMQARIHTGSTFFPVIGHRRLQTEQKFVNTFVGLFRDPRRRVLSAFNYHRHSFGFVDNEEILKAATSLEEFLAVPGIAGCQVKQLIGNACASNPEYKLSEEKALKAALLMKRYFVFVGLTDHFSTSLCLFHRMFGGKIEDAEFANSRSTSNVLDKIQNNGYSVLPSSSWKTLEVKHDKYDWLLYVIVLDVFRTNLKKYGVLVPHELETQWQQTNRMSCCKIWIKFVKATFGEVLATVRHSLSEGKRRSFADILQHVLEQMGAIPKWANTDKCINCSYVPHEEVEGVGNVPYEGNVALSS
eukprot:m.95934 g.95934  ORF g.95934 m.95934 type:complete len:546 (-) comp8958_c0_seq36:73-1710(-)